MGRSECGWLASFLALIWMAVQALAADPAPFHIEPADKLAQGVFLVASRVMPDPRFAQTVILLLEHDETGTLGVIINHGSDVALTEAVPDLRGMSTVEHHLYFGGPVATDTLLLLASSDTPLADARPVQRPLYWSVNRSVLEKLLQDHKPADQMRAYLGSAGWAPLQLEAEIAQGGWHLMRADPSVVFARDPRGLWDLFMEARRAILVRVAPKPIPGGARLTAADGYSKTHDTSVH